MRPTSAPTRIRTLSRDEAKGKPGQRSDSAETKPAKAKDALPPPEHQQASALRYQQQTRRQQHLQHGGTESGGRAQSDSARPDRLPAGGAIEGDMKSEEPQGWDQAPTDIQDPRRQRHPRPDGVGGSDPDSTKRDPER